MSESSNEGTVRGRVLIVIYILSPINLLTILRCYGGIANTTGAEGIGAAFLAFGCLAASVALTALGLACVVSAAREKRGRIAVQVFSMMLAAAPLWVCYLLDVRKVPIGDLWLHPFG